MATSRSFRFSRAPLQRPTLTPGPLGHNDAASPETPKRFVGDTPGPLGKNDHADPNFAAGKGVRAHGVGGNSFKSPTPVKNLRISDEGIKFIWDEEYVAGISERLHWPRGASGVTLGAGYDMKTRTEEQVLADLKEVGLSETDRKNAAKGAGLAGEKAENFVYENVEMVSLTEGQALKLLRLVLESYQGIVKRLVKVPLLQHEFDAVVSFAYNPAGRLGTVINCINEEKISEAMGYILQSNTSGGKVLKGLSARRIREVNLYLSGKYKR